MRCINFLKMKSKNISKIYSLLLVFFPLVCNFDIFIISPMLLLCILEFFLAFIWCVLGNSLKIDKIAIPYIIYVVISASVAIIRSWDYSIYTLTVKLLLYVLTFFVFYVFYWQIIDYEFAIKCYVYVTVALSIIMIIQFGLAQMGIQICMLPDGIPLVGNEDITTSIYRENQLSTSRFSTIFLEPAHMSTYLLPCLSVVLFRENKRKINDIIIAFALSLGNICTSSSIGILGTASIWILYLFYLLISGRIRKAFWIVFLLPVFMLAVVFFMHQEVLLSNIIERLAALDLSNKAHTQGYRRIRYGWLCFGRIDVFHKIFGLGYQNFGYYISKSGIGNDLLGTSDLSYVSYSSGITSMLLGIGVIGFFLNIRLYLLRAFSCKKILIFSLILLWGIIMFSTAAFDNISSLMVVVFIMYNVNKEKKHQKWLIIS